MSPPWTNQRLILFHGTLSVHAATIVSSGVNVTLGRPYTDFGQGFYTTTVEQQARSWAWQLSLRRRGTFPAVVRFDVDRDQLASLQSLWFVRGSFNADDYWSLVFHCRRGGAAHGRAVNNGWYDIVVGPVAASWRTRLTIHDADQISFHTPPAAALLDASNPTVLP
jgi:hypothetical protein